jgi:hypothetical protein
MIIFYSYSHKDEELRDELEVHLSALVREKVIESRHDRRISPGEAWPDAVDSQIAAADVILLLISADFVASDYCYGHELKLALNRHELEHCPGGSGDTEGMRLAINAVWNAAGASKGR